MNPQNRDYIAIDIAKDSLCGTSSQGGLELKNNPEGFALLKKQVIDRFEHPFVVFEATGGYERALMRFLHLHSITFSLTNPARVRAFARSEGIRAKNDPIDAQMLLRFAKEKNPPQNAAPEPARDQLAALLDRRHHLSEQLAREKNRLQKCEQWTQGSIERSIAFIVKELERLDQEIETLIGTDELLREHSERLQSVKGVGKITAWTLLAYLPELKQLNRNQAVALAGLAPFDRDSGKMKGRRCIQAGRAKVRRCLYMAAQTAARHNPVIKSYVEGLIARGKHYKMAIVAAMRKLLIHLQSLLKKPHFELVR